MEGTVGGGEMEGEHCFGGRCHGGYGEENAITGIFVGKIEAVNNMCLLLVFVFAISCCDCTCLMCGAGWLIMVGGCYIAAHSMELLDCQTLRLTKSPRF